MHDAKPASKSRTECAPRKMISAPRKEYDGLRQFMYVR